MRIHLKSLIFFSNKSFTLSNWFRAFLNVLFHCCILRVVKSCVIAWWLFGSLNSQFIFLCCKRTDKNKHSKWKHNELCWFLFFFYCQQWKSIQHAKFTCQMSWNSNNKQQLTNNTQTKTASDPTYFGSFRFAGNCIVQVSALFFSILISGV